MANRISLKVISIGLGLLFFLFSCKKENSKDCLKSKGEEETRIIPISQVDSIFIGRRLNCFLVHDTANFVEVKAGKNLLNLIQVETNENALSINDLNKCNWVRDLSTWPTVTLHLNSFRVLSTLGTCNIKSLNQLKFSEMIFDIYENNGSIELDVDLAELYVIQHTGTSDVKVTGQVEWLRVYMAGISKGDYKGLDAANAELDQRSSANCEANVMSNIYVSIFNDGNVIVKGNPSIQKFTQLGKGELIFH